MALWNDLQVHITDKEYKMFADFIYAKSGIHLGEEKKDLLKARLMKRIRAHHLQSWREYYDYIQDDETGEELVRMLDAVSTNVTQFFREQVHFDFLKNIALPKIFQAKEKKKERTVRIWSAAVSTGEELYSMLMTIADFLKNTNKMWIVKALGSDISTKALRTAQKAVYPIDRLKGLSLYFVENYFTKGETGGADAFRIKESLRRLAIFRRLNLVTDHFPFSNKFDIIFCRNVMIYFDKPTQELLVNKLSQHLHDDGFLFIGHAESLIGIKTHLVSVAPAIYKKAS